MQIKKYGSPSRALATALILSSGALSPSSHAEEKPAFPADWRETYAYAQGMQAYVFGFPYIYLPSLRWDWVTQPKPPGSITPYAPVNHFYNVKALANASYRGGGSPNQDTLYSIAWVDVRKEPVILSHPDMGERYFTFEIASIDSDNFAYVGKRTTGGKAGSFAIAGPGWKGTLPDGVTALPHSPTPWVLIFGRTLVDGEADVPNVNALQDQFSLVPLSYWGRKGATLPASRDVWKPWDPKTDPLAEWKTMNRALTENPPSAALAPLLQQFATFGIGPNQDVEKMDDATKRGLARAAVDGRKLLNDVIRSGDLGRQVNHWNIPPAQMGRAGQSYDFLLRAALQCLGGIIANDPAEAVYFNTARDGSGAALDGAKHYTIHFAPGEIPKTHAFWSLTLYDPTYNFTPNPINRYSIGNRTQGLKMDADGGLTIYIQSTPPASDKEANWLPSTKDGPFILILRTYMPGKAIVDQQWSPPPVEAAP